MIDFVKYDLIGIAREHLEQNTLLDFYGKVNTKTGELGTYLNAIYKGLEFKIFEPTTANPKSRITVEGSIHKYWNNGAHNFNDFGINEIDEVVKDLNNKFGITPINCVLKQLEIGVNIDAPIKTKTLLKHCLLHKTDRLKWISTKDEGNYIQAHHQRYILKIYDKRTHYEKRGFKVGKEILRLEIKYLKMHDLNRKGIFTLQDLLNFGLENFTPILLEQWKQVIFYEFKALHGTQHENTYSNPNYWDELSYERLKYHRNNLEYITMNNPENIKNKISKLIKEKCDFLNIQTTEINPLNIKLLSVDSTFKNEDKK